MRPHIFNTILHIFIIEFSLSNLLCLTHFCHLKKKTTLFPPSPPEFTSSIFSTVTIHLQLLHIYFTMSKQKFIRMVTLNTLETMIEYTLISSIPDKIYKMTTKALEYPRDPTLLNPLKNLVKIKTWGT